MLDSVVNYLVVYTEGRELKSTNAFFIDDTFFHYLFINYK